MTEFSNDCPTKYGPWNTWELIDLLKAEYQRRPRFDRQGRLTLVQIEPRPVPVDLHLELSRRTAEIRAVMEMRREGLGGMAPETPPECG